MFHELSPLLQYKLKRPSQLLIQRYLLSRHLSKHINLLMAFEKLRFMLPESEAHPITHKSSLCELVRIACSIEKNGNLLHAQSDRLSTRLPIMFSAQKSTALCNQPYHVVKR